MKTYQENMMELDLEALAHNLDYIKQLAGMDKQIIASVKANAYGHDVKQVAQILQQKGVEALATGSLEEAREIRKHGIDTPVLLFSFATPQQTILAAQEGFIPTIPNLQTAIEINSACSKPIPVYLKVDCGLGRLGVPINKAKNFVKSVAQMDRLKIAGIYTHVPFSNEASSDWAQDKLNQFDCLIDDLRESGYPIAITQAMASCCLLTGLQDKTTSVCVGHALYGLSPFDSSSSVYSHSLRPVIRSVTSTLIHIGGHPQGSDIAISGLYRTAQSHRVGVLPVGMSLGLRSPVEGQRMCVLVNGKICPVLAVSLEHTSISLDNVEDVAIGDQVTLIGRNGDETLSLLDLANSWHLTPLQTLMRISGRFSIRQT